MTVVKYLAQGQIVEIAPDVNGNVYITAEAKNATFIEAPTGTDPTLIEKATLYKDVIYKIEPLTGENVFVIASSPVRFVIHRGTEVV